MPVRIKEGMIPYTGGIGIEITNNHVINVLLRELNNLIQVNGDRELYVDLQLMDNILPTSDFPVGVTTGKILQANGWQQSGLILNWKTTSGDYCRLIYANDGKLYYDPGTGVWNQIFLSSDVADLMIEIQNLVDIALDNYYTKTEVDNLIGSLTSISFVILSDVSDLPSVGDTNKIYLVPNSQDPTIYDEYIWDTTNQDWVIVGTTAVNLADYVTINTNQTITGTKTFTAEPILPNKTTDATNNGTKPATEAQVYKVAQSVPTKVSDLANDSGYITGGALGNGKITINQGGSKKGEFTVNQSGNTTIDLDAGGGGGGGASVDNTPYGPSWNGVTNVAPSKNAVYDKIQSIDTNVKKFEISSTSDISTAQAVYDWYTEGKLPIIVYYYNVSYTDASGTVHNVAGDYTYYLEPYDSNSEHLHFVAVETANNGSVDNTNGYTIRQIPYIEILSSSGTVTSISAGVQREARLDFIAPGVNYTNPYIPEYAGSPATKKYVDDRNWVGTQAQYDALVSGGQIVQGVIYNIISS